MLLPQKKDLPKELHEQLRQYVYDIVGYCMDVTKQLPCGLPEPTPNRIQSHKLA